MQTEEFFELDPKFAEVELDDMVIYNTLYYEKTPE